MTLNREPLGVRCVSSNVCLHLKGPAIREAICFGGRQNAYAQGSLRVTLAEDEVRFEQREPGSAGFQGRYENDRTTSLSQILIGLQTGVIASLGGVASRKNKPRP